MSLVSANDPTRPKRRTAALDERACLGCGACVPPCPKAALRLVPRPGRVITPVDSTHRIVTMAIERGTLADLVFDNRTLARHRAMAAILGVVLRLPPVKQALASRQFRSRYLEALLARRAAL
jgi:ferredoxin